MPALDAHAALLTQSVLDSELVMVALLDAEFRFLRVNRGYALLAEGQTPEWYVGQEFFDVYPGEETLQVFRGVLETGIPFEGRSTPYVFSDKPHRGVTYWDWTLERVTLPSGAPGLVVVLRDVSTERQALERSVSRERLLASLARAANVLVCSPSPDEALGAVLGELGDGSGCDVVSAVQIDRPGALNRLYRWASSSAGPAPDLMAADALVMQQWQEVARGGRSLFIHIEGATDGERRVLDSWHLRSLLLTPIRKEAHVWGILTFGSVVGRDWEPIEVGAVETATAAIGAVLFRHEMEKRLLESEKRQRELAERITDVQEQEHRRVGRDLHDGLGQRLGVIRLTLGSVAARMSPGARKDLEAIGSMVADAMGESRRLAHNLHPAVIDDLGLGPALSALCEELTLIGGIDAVARVHLPCKTLPRRVRTPIYRITQEALQNVVRHAKARSVVVSLNQTGSCLELVVRDDGVGIGSGERRGLGLASMAERAELSGGTFEVRGGEHGGTVVRATWPFVCDG